MAITAHGAKVFFTPPDQPWVDITEYVRLNPESEPREPIVLSNDQPVEGYQETICGLLDGGQISFEVNWQPAGDPLEMYRWYYREMARARLREKRLALAGWRGWPLLAWACTPNPSSRLFRCDWAALPGLRFTYSVTAAEDSEPTIGYNDPTNYIPLEALPDAP